MENPEDTLQVLEEWASRRPRQITNTGMVNPLPGQLDEYLMFVARTGDPVFHWASVKPLIQEKLMNAINEFNETSPGLDVPAVPNVDPFNYEGMRAVLLERIDSFTAAPFTVQRLCELLTAPRKQYNRIDKFMRAVEKNVLVVSTREPGAVRREEEPVERALNGSDGNSDCGVDVDMEESTWRDLRHPAADPLAGASNRNESERSDVTTILPVMTTSVASVSPQAEEKMDDTSEKVESNDKLADIVVPKETPTEDIKTDDGSKTDNDNMEIEVSKESEPIQTDPPESIKESECDAMPAIRSSSEEDSNSNPEPLVSVVESEPEAKPDSITSGEDSSSSNSSENTDGESERGGGDARSPERSVTSEGDNSCEPPERDEDSKPECEQSDKVDTLPDQVEREKYTVADIHTESTAVIYSAVEKSPEPENVTVEVPITQEPVTTQSEEPVDTAPAEEVRTEESVTAVASEEMSPTEAS